MILRRTRSGLSHGEAPAGEPFLMLRLKPGWVLGPDGNVLRSAPAGKGRRAALAAPPTRPPLTDGAHFVQAIPQLSPQGGEATSADVEADPELARFVQLRLPRGAALGEWLERVRSWEFVESAQIPPPVAELP